ncbi:hypothetical protein BDQ17DRAFT_1331769 [Cyathus striatus]|nr:hypothetical protein BDQ17DRAFT_1331769 [Cyathus striatus]
MHQISAEQMVAALFAAALTTGLYFSTLGYTIRWLIFSDSGWKIRRRINWIMLTASLAIFLLSSVHLCLAARETILEVRSNNIPHQGTTKTGWSATVMMYRCWLTYSKRKLVIIFPSIFWVGGLVCIILQVYWQIVQSADIVTAWQPVNMSIGPGTVLTPFWSSTIVINIYTTSMIVYRIWRSGTAVKSFMPTEHLSFTMRVLVESGALYLIVAIPHFVVWWTPNSAAIVFFGWMNLPVAGIAFNLILIRIAKNRAENEKKVYGQCTETNIQFTTPTQRRYSIIRSRERRESQEQVVRLQEIAQQTDEKENLYNEADKNSVWEKGSESVRS